MKKERISLLHNEWNEEIIGAVASQTWDDALYQYNRVVIIITGATLIAILASWFLISSFAGCITACLIIGSILIVSVIPMFRRRYNKIAMASIKQLSSIKPPPK